MVDLPDPDWPKRSSLGRTSSARLRPNPLQYCCYSQNDPRSMPSAAPPPNPCLVAILLVVQSRSGPRLVFHYPPEPLSTRQARDHNKEDDSGTLTGLTSSASDTESSSTTDEDTSTQRGKNGSGRNQKLRSTTAFRAHLTDEEDDDISGSDDAYRRGKEWQPEWEPLFGLEGLVSLLTPSSRTWHKKKFEVGINDLCFLGWPVFIREDGTWQKRKTKSRRRKNRKDTSADSTEQDTAEDANAEGETGTKPERTSSISSELTMFSVVFVMNPPILEYTLRTTQMYDNVIKKFGKALKWEQERQNYVWTETETMLSIKSKHNTKRSPTSAVYAELLSRSSLAQAISSVYTSISTSFIASITLSPNTPLSLQIPPITSTPTLPSLTDPPTQPGIWLTTANEPASSNTDTDDSPTAKFKNLTLLLTVPPTQILKDVANTPIQAPLSILLSHLKPTKSFHKISLASSISLTDLHLLARHLISWRRAIAIPPLHQRDTYIVSPNCDLRKLKSACKAYESQFPTLPSLAKILSFLSGPPKPWGTFFPSPDHKDAYMQILAWLMRGGWVTQLRSFAFVRVDSSVKKVIKEQERAEKEEEEEEAKRKNDEDGGEEQKRHRPSLTSRPSNNGDTHRKRNGKPSASEDENSAILILNPNRASPLESKYLQHIAETLLTTNYSSLDLSEQDRAELRKYWSSFTKYFNGTEALEKIPVRVGLKRKIVWDVLGRVGLFTDGDGEGEEHQGKVLVGVRHW